MTPAGDFFKVNPPLPPGFPESSTPPPARISRIPSVGWVWIFSGTTHYAYIGTWMHMHTGVGWHLNKENVLWSTISWSEMWKQNNYKLFFFHYSFNHRTVSQALFHVFHHWHHLWSVLHVRLRVMFREVDVGGFCKRDRLHITVEPRYFEVPREMEKSSK